MARESGGFLFLLTIIPAAANILDKTTEKNKHQEVIKLFLNEVLIKVIEAIKREIPVIKNEAGLPEKIKKFPSREFDDKLATTVAHNMAEAAHITIDLEFNDNHSQFAKKLGQALTKLAKHHAETCPDCDESDAAYNALVFFLNKYLYGDIANGAPLNLPSGGSLIIVSTAPGDLPISKIINSFQPGQNPEESKSLTGQALKNRVRNWDITGNKK